MVVRKTTTATKAAPAKASATKATRAPRKPAAKPEPEPDLLADLDEPDDTSVDEDELDLLAGITEENGTAWMPWDDDDQPSGIQGRVTFVGTVSTDSKYGAVKQVPYIELQDSKDPEQLWTLRGYSTAMESQLTRTDPQVGDLFAIKYLGEASSKNGNDYHNVKAAVQHR